MGLTVTKSGPYFNGTNAPSNTTNMKFSQLRNTFRLNNPTGAISASELLRDIDTANSTDPIVPDATENVAIAPTPINTASNWKVSQFQGAIKFYDVEQDASDTNANFNISTLAEFNNNLGKTIKKKFIMRGTHTSTNTGDPAAKILTAAFNLTLEIHGNFYGAGGVGGTSSSLSGTNGGTALSINSGRVTVDIQPSGRLWGGGGGGEFGADGSQGSAGTCQKDTTVTACNTTPSCPPGQTLVAQSQGGCCALERFCWGPWQSFCGNNCVGYTQVGTCRQTAPSLTPATVIGGNGGLQVEDLITSQVHYLVLLVHRVIAHSVLILVSHFKLAQVLVVDRVELVAQVESGVKMVQTQQRQGQVDLVEMQSLELVSQ